MFTNEQLEIIHAKAAYRVVYAGPGSGKTAVLTNHLATLLQAERISPSAVCVMTFTRQAAGELKQRLRTGGRLSPSQIASLRIGTFHSLVFRMLLQMKIDVAPLLTESEQLRLIRSVINRLGIRDKPETWISRLAKVNACWPCEEKSRTVQRVRLLYERQKKLANRWDHDDVLVRFCEHADSHNALSQIPLLKYMLIDEFQDTNAIQIHILSRLCTTFNAPLFAVGDEDQSIYGFRGASPEWLLRFPEMFTGAVRHYLSANFRSDASIVRHSHHLISHNLQRSGKAPVIISSTGGICKAIEWKNEWQEAKGVSNYLMRRATHHDNHHSVAVLARTRMQLEHVARYLPSSIRPSIQFHTFHGSKGKEWDEVHVVGLVENNPYEVGARRDVDEEEERRLVYVAMTRSRHQLFLHAPRFMRGITTRVSPFIEEANVCREQGANNGVDPFLNNVL